MQPAGEGGTFLAAAQQGMFAIDTVAAGELTASIEQVRENLIKRRMRLLYLENQAMLGDLGEAKAIAKLDALVASGDPQSLNSVLRHFTEVLDDLHQALEICMRNYKQIDAQAAQDFRRISER